MQMGYDFEDGRKTAHPGALNARFAEPWQARGEFGEGPLGDQHPDWSGLKARFLAIHALRRTLAVTVEAVPAGSFAAAGESVLAACRLEPRGVNPVYSGNGKGTPPITGLVAVTPTPGDRGMQ